MGITVENILIILSLFVVAGGGIIVVDVLIVRKIRRLGPPKDEAPTARRIDT